MTTYQPGESVTLTAEWRTLIGGPLAVVTGVTVAILSMADGTPLLPTTSVGVTNPGVGLNGYSWTIPLNAPDGSYVATWTGLDTDGDTVTATEVLEISSPLAGYTTLALVKAQLGKITVDDRDEMIQASIMAASRHIDNVTGRWAGAFRQDAAPSTRTFSTRGRAYNDGTNRVAIMVDDISTDVAVTVEGGMGASGVYSPLALFTTGPENAIIHGTPITTIYASSSFLNGIDSVRVTARWGWPTMPSEVEYATRILAARLYRRKDSPQGVIASADWGSMRVSRTDPDVQALIAHLVLPGFA